jgi:hypothetical protein
MLYCETAFVITDIPPNPPIVKRLAASAVLRRARHRERYREWWARARFATLRPINVIASQQVARMRAR